MVLQLTGRLDGNTSPKLEAAFNQQFVAKHSQFVFDCASLDYISSAGLRVVLLAAKKLKSVQGKLVLSGMNQNIREVFEMSGFATIFDIFSSREEALQGLSS